ncbi:MAG TPA: excinuclease ABC subunit UvrC [bacterium]|nr:excinuclease ABC subunit UvrC [bacterium]
MPSLIDDIFPENPGVYIMRDKNNNVLYVGKAKVLQNRIRSYINPDNPRIRDMVSQVEDVDYIVTSSEIEALILENNLIKQYRPPYNVRLKDDKTYPYILITKDKYPILTVTRRIEDKGEYFGPYTSTQALRAVIHVIRKRFKIRSCTGDPTRFKNACLNYHLGLCSAPCINDSLTFHKSYMQDIKEAVKVLNGDSKEIINDLKEEMFHMAGELDFEKAAALRDQIIALKKTAEKQYVVSTKKIDADVFAIFTLKSNYSAVVLFIRRGVLIGLEDFEIENPGEEDVLGAFVTAFYRNGNYIPPLVVVNQEIKDKKLLEEWLNSRSQRRVDIKYPRKGELKKLLDIAEKNVLERFNQKIVSIEDPLISLKEVLGLSKLPETIEGYDISNIRGMTAVGSMVVFKNGKPYKNGYRKFRIKTVEGPNDYAMLQEVLWRRLDNGDLELPDLILIDGGLGQVGAAREVLASKGLDIPVIGLAKREEVIWFPEGNSLRLSRRSEALRLLQKVRDEAHRFAVKYHHQLREKELQSSLLDIPGVGKERTKKILLSYPDLSTIKDIPVEELAKSCRIPKNVAEEVKKWVENL